MILDLDTLLRFIEAARLEKRRSCRNRWARRMEEVLVLSRTSPDDVAGGATLATRGGLSRAVLDAEARLVLLPRKEAWTPPPREMGKIP